MRTKEVCDHGIEVGAVHNGRGLEEPILLRKSKESGKRENCEKNFVTK